MDCPRLDRPRRILPDGNVVVTVRPGAYAEVRDLLLDLGPVSDTPRENVVMLHARDPLQALRTLKLWCRLNPSLRERIDHAVPVTCAFEFDDCADFVSGVTEAFRGWLPRLAGKSVAVRGDAHGRCEEELWRRREHEVADILARTRGETGVVPASGDPDVVIALECLDHWAGLSLWTRWQLQRYPELGLAGDCRAA